MRWTRVAQHGVAVGVVMALGIGVVGSVGAAPVGEAVAGPAIGADHDFGTVTVGLTSASQAVTVPLTTTIGEQRSTIDAQIAAGGIVFGDISYGGLTILTAAQVKTATVAALASLPDSTPIAFRVDHVGFGTGTDFAISGDCVGADGATTPSCTELATFSPTRGGQRTDAIDVGVTTTQGFDAVAGAFATQIGNLYGVSPSLVSIAIGLYSPLVHPQVDAAIGGALNPVATFSGVGVSVVSIAASTAIMEGSDGKHVVGLPVVLNAPSTEDVTVAYATADGTARAGAGDYTRATGTVTIPAGASAATVPVTVNGDAKAEGAETFSVGITAASGAVLGTSASLVTLLNDDLPTVKVVGSSVPEGAPVYFAITAKVPLAQDLVLQLAITGGTATMADLGSPSAGSVAVPAGTTGPVFVSIPTLLDGTKERGEKVLVTVTGGAVAVTSTSTIKGNVS